jgi:hypothetical protein
MVEFPGTGTYYPVCQCRTGHWEQVPLHVLPLRHFIEPECSQSSLVTPERCNEGSIDHVAVEQGLLVSGGGPLISGMTLRIANL